MGIGRPQHHDIRDRAQRDELLERLLRRPVFAEPDRIVREDVEDRYFHQRGEPDRRTHIVAEGEKGRAKGSQF